MKVFSDNNFINGIKSGVPIGLGYLSVSFAFGVNASLLGIPAIITILISMTNLTSAGQLAGINIIATCGSLVEIVLTQVVINSRYFLMSISLSQKTDRDFTLKHRLFCSTFITDEIFAVASSKDKLNPKFMYGLALIPYLSWTLGTIIGAIAGNVLPSVITSSLGVALYAMFIAIIIPPMTNNLGVLFTVLLASGISCAIYFLPFLSFISNGLSYIISALLASVICAILFPVNNETQTDNTVEENL